MAIFRQLFGRAARQAARDPRVQEKASDFVEKEVAPRAHAAGRKTRAAYEALRDDWRDSGEAAGRKGPVEEEQGAEAAARRAGRFLGKLHNRLNQDPEG
ncbi:hypothetical protein SAMN06265365_11832 [Tistlia consotensis]|uniref:Uncharacterized protein n=1 Tax=Tistlia consotensis USBA 355 TaxID=560819 RepID=A0A1Y6CFF9_9PROT|nr:hypothetical protein [Tistlia consotensis]SMF53494.1 hypothetical protein SAMN05428998_11933 [Tistlia consotensis USBA 355]SNR85602.1 hypothetical protein SAMN06265365_11832 [Tistlia consotensis]